MSWFQFGKLVKCPSIYRQFNLSIGRSVERPTMRNLQTSCRVHIDNVRKTDTGRFASCSVNAADDFFGFDENAADVIVVQQTDIEIDPLVKYAKVEQVQPDEQQEKFYFTSYGTVRYDSDNLPTEDPQQCLENENGSLPEDPDDGQPKWTAQFNNLVDESTESISGSFHSLSRNGKFDSFIEEQYFGGETKHSDELKSKSLDNQPRHFSSQRKHLNGIEDNSFIEEQYFGSEQENREIQIKDSMKSDGMQIKLPDEWETMDETDETTGSLLGSSQKTRREDFHPSIDKPKMAIDYVRELRAANMKLTEDTDASLKGVNLVNNKPTDKFKLDSKGFRIYKNQIKDLEEEPEMFVLQLLKESILYNDNDIVAISKPYGLQMNHGMGHRHKLTNFLPELAKYVCRSDKNSSNTPELYTVHRLDVDTTGVLLMAKNQEMARTLHDLFAEGKVEKTYWALTKKVPFPETGIVDIPIAEGSVEGKMRVSACTKLALHNSRKAIRQLEGDPADSYKIPTFLEHWNEMLVAAILDILNSMQLCECYHTRQHWRLNGRWIGVVIPDWFTGMVLRPESNNETRPIIPKYDGKLHRAVTEYKVIASRGNAALVELKPTTGVRHQLRVHLAFGIGCPIIGDHKYSHLSKMAPQKLPADILNRLRCRQSKSRYLPMHLHARGVILPGILDGNDLKIGARLPRHFLENLKDLGFKLTK